MYNKKVILLVAALTLVVFAGISMSSALAAPTVTTGSASNITATSATLSASFDVDGEDVTVFFEINGDETSGDDYSSSGTHTETVTGLSPNTEYQYRAVLQYTTGWWWWSRTYTVYGEWQTFTTEEGSTPPGGRNPILFVHGWTGSASNWYTMMNRFEAAGYDDNLLYAYTFDDASDSSSGANAENAEEIADWVDYILARTGASEVDIIAHSMGGLSSRYYIKFMGGASKVDDYVSLGTPQHGTTLMWTGDMRPGSALLDALNSGDETPAGVDWTTVRSTGDTLVLPTDTAMLEGAENFLIYGTGHMSMPSDSECYQIAKNAVDDD